MKPIDKSKKANRRCCNCEYYPEDETAYAIKQCTKTKRYVNYWNCCQVFEWSSRKQYKENADADS